MLTALGGGGWDYSRGQFGTDVWTPESGVRVAAGGVEQASDGGGRSTSEASDGGGVSRGVAQVNQ